MSDAARAVDGAVALAHRPDRLHLILRGPDRARCLHNLCTNEVRKLPAGRGREAFVTTLQGKCLAYVTLLAEPDQIRVRSDRASAAVLQAHLLKYAALDDVEVDDHSDECLELHLVGPGAEGVLRSFPGQLPEEADLAQGRFEIGGTTAPVIREAPLGRAGLTLLLPADRREQMVAELAAACPSMPILTSAEVEAFRIAAGTPASGLDVTERNLPQEVGRDDRAISFVKGCYLGQETVARLDALGHVNRMLRGLRVEGEQVPAPDSVLLDGMKEAGRITSAARSARTGRPIALGYVRTAYLAGGTELTCRDPAGLESRVIVSALPIEP